MSTIKSDSENLTLNAHGSGNDIKFQSNSVEVGSITDAGQMNATLFAGSGASLTNIPAANITGTLPAISGANLTNLPAQTDSTKLPLAGGTLTGDLIIGVANAAGLNSSGLALTNEFRIHGGADGGVMSLATYYKAYQLGAGDVVGALYFTDATSGVWAGIKASADAQGGGSSSSPLNANDYPGRLEFLTTPDGSGTPTVRMTINRQGRVGIGTTSPIGALDVVGATALNNAALHVKGTSSTTNDLIPAFSLESATTGTAAAGVGTSMTFFGSMSGQDNVQLGEIGFHNNNVSGAHGDFVVKTRPNGTLAERMRINSTGNITLGGNNNWIASKIYDLGTMAASATVTVSEGVGCNGAYEIAVWNTDGNAYGHGLYTFCCGGFNSNFTIQTPFESHYGATDVPTVSFVRVSGCNWQLRVVNNDADSKHFYASIRCVHSQ